VLLEVDGVLRLTSLEYTHNGCGGGRYYSVDGYHLTDRLMPRR